MDKIELRAIAKGNQRDIYILVMAGVLVSLYFLSGVFYIGTPRYLNLTTFEQHMPLMPWTIWIYVALYPFLVWAIRATDNNEIFNKTLYTFLTVVVISCGIFIVFPISYPRELYPLFTEPGATANIFTIVRSVDKPNNCLPSLHVSMCYLVSFGLLRCHKYKGIFAIIASTVISYSTLTTKQHYVWDIYTGLAIAIICHLIIFKFFKISEHH